MIPSIRARQILLLPSNRQLDSRDPLGEHQASRQEYVLLALHANPLWRLPLLLVFAGGAVSIYQWRDHT